MGGLIWANLDDGSYQRVWNTLVSVRVGQWDLSLTLRQWINSGLMAFFFLVVGLEARREFDVGEFRERPRIVVPVVAGLGGMLGAIGIYVAVNAGRSSIHGWGASMSTDTAFALGVFALLGSRAPNRLRGLILTVTVVDDIVGLAVIATVYSHHLSVAHLLVAAGAFAVAALAAWRRVRSGLVYFGLAAISWVALAKSGVDPIIVGLAAGLIAYAAPANRSDLERATSLVRDFREQPTPGRAQVARAGLATAISPNDRLAQIFHPWTSYVIVPLFGLANAGIPIDAKFLAGAYRSPITLGIILGYVIGKPLGVTLAAAVVTKASRGRLRPPVGWAVASQGRHRGRRVHRFTVDRLGRLPRQRLEGGHPRDPDRRGGLRRWPGWSSPLPPGSRPPYGPERSWAAQRSSSISSIPSTPISTTCAAPPTPRPPWSNTATFNAPTAQRPSRPSASSWPTSPTCAMRGGSYHSTTYTPRPNWPPKPPRRPRPKGRSGRCTTCS